MSGGLIPYLTPTSLPEVSYAAPKSVEGAVALLEKYGDKAKIIAGGSDLLHLMKRGAMVPAPQVLVDLKGIDQLRGLSTDPVSGLSLGALVTIGQIEASPVVAAACPLLGMTADLISSPQVRNVATVGGAISQQVWCWFLRNAMRCWRAGGSVCFATQEGADNRYHFSVMGANDCFAAHPSDLAVALEALDASVEIAGPNGSRTVTLQEFLPGEVRTNGTIQSHILTPSELVTSVRVPPQGGRPAAFSKSRIRNAFDFSIASVAVVLTVDGSVVKDSRVVFGGVATAPYRDTVVEAVLNGSELSSISVEAVASSALASASPLQENGYVVDVARGVLMDALTQLSNEQ